MINPSTMCWPILLLQEFLLSDRLSAFKQSLEMQSKFSEIPVEEALSELPGPAASGLCLSSWGFSRWRWKSPGGIYVLQPSGRVHKGGKCPDYRPYPKCRGVLVSYAVFLVLILVHQKKIISWALEAE